MTAIVNTLCKLFWWWPWQNIFIPVLNWASASCMAFATVSTRLKMNLLVVESESKKECTAFERVNENLQGLACVSFPLAFPSLYPGALWGSRAPVPCQAGNPTRTWSYGSLLRICSRRLPVVWLNSFKCIAQQHLCNSSVSGVGQWPFKCWQGGTEQKFTSEIIHFWWGK